MQTIKFLSKKLSEIIADNENFKALLPAIQNHLDTALSKLPSDSYCLFIDIASTDDNNHIIFHDGGATYNPITKDLDYIQYLNVETKLVCENYYRLYFSIKEELLCLVCER